MRKRSGVASSQLLILAFSIVACAHTRGPKAESPDAESGGSALSCRDDETLANVNKAEADDAVEAPHARPPERHSISLGTTFVPPRWLMGYGMGLGMGPGYMPTGMAAPIVVNNYYQPNPPQPNSGTVVSPYYYPSVISPYYSGAVSPYSPYGIYRTPAVGRGLGAGTTASPGSTPHLGGDWPSVPSFGPKMPTKTAPAPTWAR